MEPHSVVASTSKTEFAVLISSDPDAWVTVAAFLDRYLGEWRNALNPETASMQVLWPEPDSTFNAEDTGWARKMFERFGTEARVYEFNRFSNQLRAINLEELNQRAQQKPVL